MKPRWNPALVALLASLTILLAGGADMSAAASCNWHSETWWKNASPHDVKVCSRKKDVNFSDANGRRPIHWATKYVPAGNVKTLKALIGIRGIKLNVADRDGRTASHVAARYRGKSIMKALLAGGAHPDLRDSNGITPVMVTQAKRQREISGLLTDHGAVEVCTTGWKIGKKLLNVSGSAAIGCGIGVVFAFFTAGASLGLCAAGAGISLLPQAGDIITRWDCDLNIQGGYEIKF